MRDLQAAGIPGGLLPGSGAVRRFVAHFDDILLARPVLIGLLIGAIGVIAIDVRDIAQQFAWQSDGKSVSVVPSLSVRSPVPDTNVTPPSHASRHFFTQVETPSGQRMSFTTKAGGALVVKGSIDQGAAARLAHELDARGGHVKVVSLDSPGGSLDDAMAMARLIRERGLATEVADGAICVSSCPLLLAGGRTRTVAAKAAVGVHQFYTMANATATPQQAMADAQMTTARISRHLIEMGVDPALWVHALDTPPHAIYYFSDVEMDEYRLVTRPPGADPETGQPRLMAVPGPS